MTELKIYFGPYESHGIIRHKTQKMSGVLGHLGYEIELIPTKRLNTLVVHLNDKEIYRCNIKHLMFNIDYEDDPIAQKIVECIEEARTRFESEDNISAFAPKNKSLTTTKEYFARENVDLIYEIGTILIP